MKNSIDLQALYMLPATLEALENFLGEKAASTRVVTCWDWKVRHYTFRSYGEFCVNPEDGNWEPANDNS